MTFKMSDRAKGSNEGFHRNVARVVHVAGETKSILERLRFVPNDELVEGSSISVLSPADEDQVVLVSFAQIVLLTQDCLGSARLGFLDCVLFFTRKGSVGAIVYNRLAVDPLVHSSNDSREDDSVAVVV